MGPQRIAEPSQPAVLGLLGKDMASCWCGFYEPSMVGVYPTGVGAPCQALVRHELLHLRVKTDAKGRPFEPRSWNQVRSPSLYHYLSRIAIPGRPELRTDEPGPDRFSRSWNLNFVTHVNLSPPGVVFLWPSNHLARFRILHLLSVLAADSVKGPLTRFERWAL